MVKKDRRGCEIREAQKMNWCKRRREQKRDAGRMLDVDKDTGRLRK